MTTEFNNTPTNVKVTFTAQSNTMLNFKIGVNFDVSSILQHSQRLHVDNQIVNQLQFSSLFETTKETKLYVCTFFKLAKFILHLKTSVEK